LQGAKQKHLSSVGHWKVRGQGLSCLSYWRLLLKCSHYYFKVPMTKDGIM